MAHFAKVVDGKVINVIVAEPDFFDDYVDSVPGDWIQTSINMENGVHIDPVTKEPTPDQETVIAAQDGRQRWNYACVGMIYDPVRDAFYHEAPYASWTLSDTTKRWEPPVAMPDDGQEYRWDEDTQSWEQWSAMPASE
jgi:hypothetical protein